MNDVHSMIHENLSSTREFRTELELEEIIQKELTNYRDDFQRKYSQFQSLKENLQGESEQVLTKHGLDDEKDLDDENSDDENEIINELERAEKVCEKIQEIFEKEEKFTFSKFDHQAPPPFPLDKVISVFCFTMLVVGVYFIPNHHI